MVIILRREVHRPVGWVGIEDRLRKRPRMSQGSDSTWEAKPCDLSLDCCEFRNEHATFIGKLPIGNARAVRFFGQADFQAIIVWKDNFAVEEDARKMQDKNSEQHKKRGPVGHEWRVAGIFLRKSPPGSGEFFTR